MHVEHKIFKNVLDSVCLGCPQNWENICRAYSMPHSQNEREFRLSNGGGMNCQPKAITRKVTL